MIDRRKFLGSTALGSVGLAIVPTACDRPEIDLDFEGVETIYVPFLHASIGRLLNYVEKETLLTNLSFCNISDEQSKAIANFNGKYVKRLVLIISCKSMVNFEK